MARGLVKKGEETVKEGRKNSYNYPPPPLTNFRIIYCIVKIWRLFQRAAGVDLAERSGRGARCCTVQPPVWSGWCTVLVPGAWLHPRHFSALGAATHPQNLPSVQGKTSQSVSSKPGCNAAFKFTVFLCCYAFWGKVMFLHLSVILLTGGVSVWCHFLSGCLAHIPSGGVSVNMGFLWKGGLWEKGVSLIRGSLWKGGPCEREIGCRPPILTSRGGHWSRQTCSTEMYSCSVGKNGWLFNNSVYPLVFYPL